MSAVNLVPELNDIVFDMAAFFGERNGHAQARKKRVPGPTGLHPVNKPAIGGDPVEMPPEFGVNSLPHGGGRVRLPCVEHMDLRGKENVLKLQKGGGQSEPTDLLPGSSVKLDLGDFHG